MGVLKGRDRMTHGGIVSLTLYGGAGMREAEMV